MAVKKYLFLKVLFIASVVLVFTGCDAVYRLLQKEGAEERDIIGEIVPSMPNPAVEEVQSLLRLYGYNVGNIDGKMGPNTRYALAAFQKDNNLKESKFIDKDTWEKLNELNRSGLVVNGEIDFSTVQLALQNAGFNPGEIDGKFGPRTQKMLQRFQGASGLKADGKVGPKTLKALVRYLPIENPQ